MAIMMVFMAVWLAMVPGGHMGSLGSRHSTEQTPQALDSDAAKPEPEGPVASQDHDGQTQNRQKP